MPEAQRMRPEPVVAYPRDRERFLRDTSEHTLTVLLDDDGHRHLRFKASRSSFYWFDIVTWPGRTVITGDAGDWMFRRDWDLFANASGYGIQPDHWSSKLLGHDPGSRMARTYTTESFEATLIQWAIDATSEWGEHDGVYTSLLVGALQREVFDRYRTFGYTDWGEYADEHQAHGVLGELAAAGVIESETWEWDLRQWDWSFLWCCWALVEGRAQYMATTSEAVPA